MLNTTQPTTESITQATAEQMGIYKAIMLTKMEIKKYGNFYINIKKLNKQIDNYNKRFNENMAKIPENTCKGFVHNPK